ncbi:midkine b [Limanda limanda]|uniref:midkine b n=1 Tax=Limanda limanda TaxID=27771 RepID=UPI0029C8AE42|nr:midkine b [Limanda limanda]
MQSLFCVTLLLLVAVVTLSDASRRNKNPRGKPEKPGLAPECSPANTRYGKCVPEGGDCGDGARDAACGEHSNKIPCRVPCNWKKDISDCKYKFAAWGSCDGVTNTKSRSGALKRALYNAECQPTVTVSKPCSPKTKRPRGEKKSN